MCATVNEVAPGVSVPGKENGASDTCCRNRLMSVRSSVTCTAFTAVTWGVSGLSVNANFGRSAKLIDGVVAFRVTLIGVPDVTKQGRMHESYGRLLYSLPA